MKTDYKNRQGVGKTSTPKPKKKIQFVKSPTGTHNLAYNEGDIINESEVSKEVLESLKNAKIVKEIV